MTDCVLSMLMTGSINKKQRFPVAALLAAGSFLLYTLDEIIYLHKFELFILIRLYEKHRM